MNFIKFIFIILSLLFFLVAYLIWKKQRLSLLAGYTEGSVSDEDKQRFAKVNGMMFVIYGILLFLYAFIYTKVNFYVVFVGFIILCFIHIAVANIKFKNKNF
ncbi:DUF3784 domain-containing protein [Fictibacillus sp. KIGAM418]|uniref:DUF3784 domain-containing protein n=1 Tax=Fictibacillus marinisediminis TaxID=2878389 RepID=A0A9X2BI46_9BACL|nr:DUF3784 domain-containing protein [Fictibacillus marinisediminis]MCK6258193.1 DUF3784 domain-containing protein [Fictibacillus marinisediminis]